MTLDGIIERWSRGWRGPALAALIAFLAGLPGVFAVPPLDRDESRFAQATAQMLETGDFVVIRFQNEPRFKKPVGIYWLQ
ncbi:MAG: glycosyltransferase family 39 protein, partial [Phenylobacterium sp.]|nr:glycosyltransferase family 39 protein [Phenylobacterium sp.]